MSLHVCLDTTTGVANGLASLYANKELTDIRLQCTDGSLLAHKSVLAAVSHRFRQWLSSDQSMAAQSVIVFADITIEDLKIIIDCIYYSQQTIDSKKFKHLSQIADKLGLNLKTAVSAALASTHVSTPMPTKTSVNPFVAPKVVSILNHKKCLKPKKIETNGLPDRKIDTSDDYPMDLTFTSVDNNTIEDNVQKIIDSIAANGPQTPTNRRRKQSDPKPIVSKVVRFEDIKEMQFYSEPSVEVFTEDLISAKVCDELATHSAPDPNALTNGQTVKEDAIDSKTSVENSSETKCEDSILCHKPKSVGRSPRSPALSEEQLKDCIVCGKSHSSHKQLILHLNRDHKTKDVFKCFHCGKEQKYAKTFAIHSLQCLSPNVMH